MSLSSLLVAAVMLSAPLRDDTGLPDDAEAQLFQLYEDSGGEYGEEVLAEAGDEVVRLRESPLDINNVRADDLLQIPGVDVNTVSAILRYRNRYGAFRSVQELDMIPEIDDRMRDYVKSMLHVAGNDSLPWYSARRIRHDIARPKQTFLFTASVPTYYRAGDKGATLAGAMGVNRYANTYLGDPLKHSLRYSLAVGENIKVNITGAKTAGEPFGCAGNNLGYDYYAYNISLRNLGCFRNITVGQFRGQFGMGLVLNNTMTFGKQAMLASVGRLTNAFRPHSGTADMKYLQGVAVTAGTERAEVAAFLSWRYVDATLNDDGTVSTILTNGYHRTRNEMDKKNNTAQTTAGIHLKYGSEPYAKVDRSVGLSFLYTRFNRTLNPVFSKADTISTSKLYRLYYPTGTAFWNAGIDYKVGMGQLLFTGEAALCDNGAAATVNNLIFNAARRLTFSLVQRYYSYKYHSLYGAGIGDGAAVQNESAVLLGVRWGAYANLVIDAYSDIAYHPWFRYRASASSYVWDNTVLATLRRRQWSFAARYRLKNTRQDKTVTDNNGASVKTLTDSYTHRFRLTALLENRRWTARSHCEGIVTGDGTKGYIVSQAAGLQLNRHWMLYATAAYFDTDDYDTRLYSYERGMLYAFNTMSYYGNGMRTALLLKSDVGRWLTARLKVGYTKYFDRSFIGTAERRIFSSHQTDIDLQMQIRL